MKDSIVNIMCFVLLTAVVTSPVACTMNRHTLMIEAMVDPIAVKCAMESDMESSAMCIAKAMQRQVEVSNAAAP